MEQLSLRFYPDPILRQVGEEVANFDGQLVELAEAMMNALVRAAGIGLAAPQVGYSTKLIIALQMEDVDDSGADPMVLVNPAVVSASNELWAYEEGCLSIPGITSSILRPLAIEVEYQDIAGGKHRLAAEGMFARILQHEIDHVNGRLFIDYLSSAQKSIVKPKLKKLSEKHHTS